MTANKESMIALSTRSEHSDLDIINFQDFDTALELFIKSIDKNTTLIELVEDMKEHDTFGRA